MAAWTSCVGPVELHQARLDDAGQRRGLPEHTLTAPWTLPAMIWRLEQGEQLLLVDARLRR